MNIKDMLLYLQGRDGYDEIVAILEKQLGEEDQKELAGIREGRILPSLTSDVIAKKIYSAEENKERLGQLLRKITGDGTIEVAGSRSSEGYIRTTSSKKVILDIPAETTDNRFADMEMQVEKQSFIFRRGDIYEADMLMIQYSAAEGQSKSEVDYENVEGVILVVLLRHSPDELKKFPSKRYIHRFQKRTADSGFSYSPVASTVYVQLDKCLRQFKRGEDGEGDAELQLELAMIANINDKKVRQKAEKNERLRLILEEVGELTQDKEVKIMLLEEKIRIDRYECCGYLPPGTSM